MDPYGPHMDPYELINLFGINLWTQVACGHVTKNLAGGIFVHFGLKTISKRPGRCLESFLEVFCFILTEHVPVTSHMGSNGDHMDPYGSYMDQYGPYGRPYGDLYKFSVRFTKSLLFFSPKMTPLIF